MTLPLTPPIEPMLSRLEREIPVGDGWLYEPKWDGFRAHIFRDHNETHIAGRGGRPLARYFPEVVEIFEECVDEPAVVDGEIVIVGKRGLEFDALQLRLHPAASRVAMLSKKTPAGFIAFDILARGKEDLQGLPLHERRRILEDLLPADSCPRLEDKSLAGGVSLPLRDAKPFVMLTPQTTDPETAATWFESLEEVGLDGLIAKRHDLTYRPGDRAMVKVKHRRTADCVVGGYRLHKSGDAIGSLLLGLYDAAGVLHYVGHTSSFKMAQRRELLDLLRPLEGGESFVGGRAPGGPSRWTGANEKQWFPVEPNLVCEVTYDHVQGERFRHAATFLRWRDDKRPEECTFEQVPALARRLSS